MATHININGTWVANSNIYTNINGSWVTCIGKYSNINGSWVKTDPSEPSLINIQDYYNTGNISYFGSATHNTSGLQLMELSSNKLKIASTQTDNLGFITLHFPGARYIKYTGCSDNIYNGGGDAALGCTLNFHNTSGQLEQLTFSIYEDRSYFSYPANTGYSVVSLNAGNLFDSRHWYTNNYHYSRVSSSAVHTYDFEFDLINRRCVISSQSVTHAITLPANFSSIWTIDVQTYAWWSSQHATDTEIRNVYLLQ